MPLQLPTELPDIANAMVSRIEYVDSEIDRSNEYWRKAIRTRQKQFQRAKDEAVGGVVSAPTAARAGDSLPPLPLPSPGPGPNPLPGNSCIPGTIIQSGKCAGWKCCDVGDPLGMWALNPETGYCEPCYLVDDDDDGNGNGDDDDGNGDIPPPPPPPPPDPGPGPGPGGCDAGPGKPPLEDCPPPRGNVWASRIQYIYCPPKDGGKASCGPSGPYSCCCYDPYWCSNPRWPIEDFNKEANCKALWSGYFYEDLYEWLALPETQSLLRAIGCLGGNGDEPPPDTLPGNGDDTLPAGCCPPPTMTCPAPEIVIPPCPTPTTGTSPGDEIDEGEGEMLDMCETGSGIQHFGRELA